MKIKKKKNVKPIDIDVHFKFICPNSDCKFDHWLNLKQCKIKNFKIVCDCGTIFSPKRIKNISINYLEKNKTRHISKQPQILESPEEYTITDSKGQIEEKKIISETLLESCISLLNNYGFTEIECNYLINKAYTLNPTDNTSTLIKYILENIKQLEKTDERNL